MNQFSVGDLSQSFLFRRQNAGLKTELQHLTTELSTGIVRDTAAKLVGDLAPLSGIETTLSRLKGYEAVTKDASLFTDAMHTALQHIDKLASQSSQSLLASVSSALNHRVDEAGTETRRQLETVMSALNARSGDRSLFAGTATSRAAVSSANDLLTSLATAASGAQTAGEVETAVTAWFASPAGYAATGYTGGPPLEPWTVAAGEAANADFTAMDPGIKDTLASFSLAALLDRGLLATNPDERTKLAQRAGVKLLETQTGRTSVAARLGTTQAHVEAAAARNAAERTALDIARNGLVAADPYDVSTKLQQTQTQLETMYAVLARMSRLSLVDYLR